MQKYTTIDNFKNYGWDKEDANKEKEESNYPNTYRQNFYQNNPTTHINSYENTYTGGTIKQIPNNVIKDVPKRVERGEVYWATVQRPHEPKSHDMRPVVIIGHDTMNIFSHQTIICPLTSSLKRTELDSHAIVRFSEGNSMALAESISVIHKSQLGDFICKLETKDFREVMRAVLFSVGAY